MDPAKGRVVRFSDCFVPGLARAAIVAAWSGHHSYSRLNGVILGPSKGGTFVREVEAKMPSDPVIETVICSLLSIWKTVTLQLQKLDSEIGAIARKKHSASESHDRSRYRCYNGSRIRRDH